MDRLMREAAADHHRFSDQVVINRFVTTLTLTDDGMLKWTNERGRQILLNIEKEVLGFVSDGVKLRIKGIVSKRSEACCTGYNVSDEALQRKDFLFETIGVDSQNSWIQHLNKYMDSLDRPKKLFVFVNPYGGKKSALKTLSTYVKPLLEDANIRVTVQETQYQLHAKEIISKLDLTEYDGIVCVSGDGILVEVVNGLLSRDDWKTAIKMPIGMVPAGTGNGMVKSLLHSAGQSCTPLNAVFAIIRGHKIPLDVATLKQRETLFFSVLMLAWGLIADIDIESEKYRWMGSARIDFYALQRIFNLRLYNGRIWFVPAPGFDFYGEATHYATVKIQNSAEEGQRGYNGPKIEPENLQWRVVNGPFVAIWLHNVPWGGETTMAAPDAKFSDGFLDLILIKECPRAALVWLMTGLSKGDHVKSPYVTYLKVKEFVLEPGERVGNVKIGGIIDVDGEVLARANGVCNSHLKTLMSYDTLQISVQTGLATVFAPLT